MSEIGVARRGESSSCELEWGGRMFLKACLNGVRRKGEHPALPCSPEEIAAAAAACRGAGAGAVHVHAKNGDGVDTLAAASVDRTVAAVRSACADLPVGVTTGAWITADPADRCAAVRSWTVLPDFASVNWHEEGALRVAEALLDRGIGVEAGLWSTHAVALWSRSPLRDSCFRVLLELPDGLTVAEVDRSARLMLEHVRDAGTGDILLHGENESAWPALDLAAAWGLSSRIGFEDTLRLPDGTLAASNAELVAAAHIRVMQTDRQEI